MKTLLVMRSGILPMVSINKPESSEANSCTKPTAMALIGGKEERIKIVFRAFRRRKHEPSVWIHAGERLTEDFYSVESERICT